MCTLLGLASFAQCHVYKEHIIVHSCNVVVSLLTNIPFCEDTVIFIHSIIDGHLNYFLFVLLQTRIPISKQCKGI